jgi:peroxiredoxin
MGGVPGPGSGRSRGVLVWMGLGIALLAVALWALSARPPVEESSRPRDHEGAVDAFEKAGVTEFKKGERGPAFRLATLQGEGWASLDDFASNLVILNFWATWCEPCAAEMPTLEALWQRYRARGLVILGVSVDRRAHRAVVDPYIKYHRLTFPILLDPAMEAADAWRVTGLPTTFIIKPGGAVAAVAVGAREWNSAQMQTLLETLLPAAR